MGAAAMVQAGADTVETVASTMSTRSKIAQEAAELKTARLKEYRETVSSNLAQMGGSGFTTQGSSAEILASNTANMKSDISSIEGQAKQQSKSAIYGGITDLTSKVTSAATKRTAAKLAKSQLKEIGGEGTGAPVEDITKG